MAIDKKLLGAAIKRVRNARGISQAQLARASGLSKSGNSVALIERGERSVTLATLNSLAEALEIPSACLTVLGSSHIEGSKEATEFMKSLQELITSIMLTQAQMEVEQDAEEAKQVQIKEEQKSLADLAKTLKALQGRQKGAKASKKAGKSPRRKKAVKKKKVAKMKELVR